MMYRLVTEKAPHLQSVIRTSAEYLSDAEGENGIRRGRNEEGGEKSGGPEKKKFSTCLPLVSRRARMQVTAKREGFNSLEEKRAT